MISVSDMASVSDMFGVSDVVDTGMVLVIPALEDAR